jgi:hypothetical protein
MKTKTIRFYDEEMYNKAQDIVDMGFLSFNQWVEQLVYREVQNQEFLSKHN